MKIYLGLLLTTVDEAEQLAEDICPPGYWLRNVEERGEWVAFYQKDYETIPEVICDNRS